MVCHKTIKPIKKTISTVPWLLWLLFIWTEKGATSYHHLTIKWHFILSISQHNDTLSMLILNCILCCIFKIWNLWYKTEHFLLSFFCQIFNAVLFKQAVLPVLIIWEILPYQSPVTQNALWKARKELGNEFHKENLEEWQWWVIWFFSLPTFWHPLQLC